MANITAEQLANELTNYVNNFNCDHDAFIKAFCRQHKTLQQSAFRMMLKLMEHMASDEYRTDGRNSQSKFVAQKLMDGFKHEVADELRRKSMGEKGIQAFIEGENWKPSCYLPTI